MSVAISLVWKWIYNGEYGVLNSVSKVFGIEGINWLSDPKYALIMVLIVEIWMSVGYNMIILLAGMQGISTSYYEAAVIDGCSVWGLMIRVILPMTKPVIATVVIFNVLYIWNEFPFASVMLRDVSDYTLSMGASFFKGTYTVDYGGIVASSIMIIIPELIFYGIFQKNIVEGMTAGAVKG